MSYARFYEACIENCLKHGIDNIAQIAYIFATVEHETAGTYRPVKEAFWLSETWREKNLRYYPWYGRGHVQLTWEKNYRMADDRLGLHGELMANPDLIIEDFGLSVEICVLGMKEGWFTGKSLRSYIDRGQCDFKNARRIINGTDKMTKISRLACKHLGLLSKQVAFNDRYVA